MKDICKKFKGCHCCNAALEDSRGIFCRGRIHALYGPNGSGKSTLLRCIAGLIKTKTGSLYSKTLINN